MTNIKNNSVDYNEIQESSAETNIYSSASDALKVKPYAKRKAFDYAFVKSFSLGYHFISFILAIATCILIAYIIAGADFNKLFDGTLNGIIYGVIAIIVSLILLSGFAWLEFSKRDYAIDIFQKKANKEKVSGNAFTYLIVLTFASIVISGLGGASISYLTSNKQIEINGDYKIQKDSIANYYQPKISEESIHIANLQKLQTDIQNRRWGLKPSEEKSLLAHQEQKAMLEKQFANAISEIKNHKQKAIISNIDATSIYIWVAVLFILIFEILNIRAYAVYYKIASKIETEGQARLAAGEIEIREKKKNNLSPPLPKKNTTPKEKPTENNNAGFKTHETFFDEVLSNTDLALSYVQVKNILSDIPNPIPSKKIYEILLNECKSQSDRNRQTQKKTDKNQTKVTENMGVNSDNQTVKNQTNSQTVSDKFQTIKQVFEKEKADNQTVSEQTDKQTVSINQTVIKENGLSVSQSDTTQTDKFQTSSNIKFGTTETFLELIKQTFEQDILDHYLDMYEVEKFVSEKCPEGGISKDLSEFILSEIKAMVSDNKASEKVAVSDITDVEYEEKKEEQTAAGFEMSYMQEVNTQKDERVGNLLKKIAEIKEEFLDIKKKVENPDVVKMQKVRQGKNTKISVSKNKSFDVKKASKLIKEGRSIREVAQAVGTTNYQIDKLRKEILN